MTISSNNIFGWVLTRPSGFLSNEFLYMNSNDGFFWTPELSKSYIIFDSSELSAILKYLYQDSKNSNIQIVELIGKTIQKS